MRNPIIRTIYLYLFALVGLALLAIGVYRFVDLGLKTWIFTKADHDTPYIARPISLRTDPEFIAVKSMKNCSEKCELTEEQIAGIDNWLLDYEEWKKDEEERQKIDYTTQRRQRTASSSLALLIVGLPMYLYHWTLIKRDVKKKEEETEEEAGI